MTEKYKIYHFLNKNKTAMDTDITGGIHDQADAEWIVMRVLQNPSPP